MYNLADEILKLCLENDHFRSSNSISMRLNREKGDVVKAIRIIQKYAPSYLDVRDNPINGVIVLMIRIIPAYKIDVEDLISSGGMAVVVDGQIKREKLAADRELLEIENLKTNIKYTPKNHEQSVCSTKIAIYALILTAASLLAGLNWEKIIELVKRIR